MQFDLTTINQEKLKTLPIYQKPQTYSISGHSGSACHGDPPGYPTYFLRSVYTQYGNSPPKGPTTVLPDTGERKDQLVIQQGGALYRAIPPHDWAREDWDEYQDKFDKLMHSLWQPLPYDHPRVRAWILATYRHHRHCYMMPEGVTFPTAYDYQKERKDISPFFIWPVGSYDLRHFHDDERFSQEWRAKEEAMVEATNREIIEARRPYAIPENHQAVSIIRRYYPQHTPDLWLIHAQIPPTTGTWWERYSHRPAPDECPGEDFLSGGHPNGDKWCQLCARNAGD